MGARSLLAFAPPCGGLARPLCRSLFIAPRGGAARGCWGGSAPLPRGGACGVGGRLGRLGLGRPLCPLRPQKCGSRSAGRRRAPALLGRVGLGPSLPPPLRSRRASPFGGSGVGCSRPRPSPPAKLSRAPHAAASSALAPAPCVGGRRASRAPSPAGCGRGFSFGLHGGALRSPAISAFVPPPPFRAATCAQGLPALVPPRSAGGFPVLPRLAAHVLALRLAYR